MNKRTIFLSSVLLSLSFMLAGCSSLKNPEVQQAVQAWIGSTEKDLVRAVGPATSVKEQAGIRYLHYYQDNTFYTFPCNRVFQVEGGVIVAALQKGPVIECLDIPPPQGKRPNNSTGASADNVAPWDFNNIFPIKFGDTLPTVESRGMSVKRYTGDKGFNSFVIANKVAFDMDFLEGTYIAGQQKIYALQWTKYFDAPEGCTKTMSEYTANLEKTLGVKLETSGQQLPDLIGFLNAYKLNEKSDRIVVAYCAWIKDVPLTDSFKKLYSVVPATNPKNRRVQFGLQVADFNLASQDPVFLDSLKKQSE